jgi:hypothetical protein
VVGVGVRGCVLALGLGGEGVGEGLEGLFLYGQVALNVPLCEFCCCQHFLWGGPCLSSTVFWASMGGVCPVTVGHAPAGVLLMGRIVSGSNGVSRAGMGAVLG